MRALILAAGKGERLRPLTLFKPKPLLEVGNQSLIERHIERLRDAGITDIVINTSWLAQQLFERLGNGEKYGVRLRFSHEGDEPLETGGGIHNALPLLGDAPFLVVNGDTWHDIEFGGLQLAAGDRINLVMVDNPDHNPEGDFVLEGDRLHEKPANGPESVAASPHGRVLTYSGVGIYHPALFAGARPGRWSVVPLIRTAIANNQAAGTYHPGQWCDIGTVKRLLQANQTLCKEHSV